MLAQPCSVRSPSPRSVSVSLRHSLRPPLADDAPFHLQTFIKLPGDFAQKHATTWSDVARYVDYLDTDQRGANQAHDAGIKVGFYTDVHLICDGSSCSGFSERELRARVGIRS